MGTKRMYCRPRMYLPEDDEAGTEGWKDLIPSQALNENSQGVVKGEELGVTTFVQIHLFHK